MMKGTRVFLADDNDDVRAALRVLLEKRLGCVVAGEGGHAATVVARVAAGRADLVLLDADLPGGVDAALLGRLAALPGPPRLVILQCDTEARADLLAAGARAFACKADGVDKFVAAIAAALGPTASAA